MGSLDNHIYRCLSRSTPLGGIDSGRALSLTMSIVSDKIPSATAHGLIPAGVGPLADVGCLSRL